jgi:DNA polymerase-3 subunit alpha
VKHFIHLHNHTDYSVRDGIQKLGPMCRVVAEEGQSAIAITDHGTLAGAWELASAAKQYGIKPVIGTEAYLVNDHTDPSPMQIGGKRAKYYHITLLAQNAEGYRNLVRMTSKGWDDMVSGEKPLIDFDMLEEHREGVIALTGCLSGPVMSHLSQNETAQATEKLDVLRQIFDQDHLYVEFMSHGIEVEDKAFRALLDLTRKMNLQPVVTNDAHFTLPDDALAQEAQLALGSQTTLLDPNHWRFDGSGYYVRSGEEMWSIFGKELSDGLNNTMKIASMIDDSVLPEAKIRIPKFSLPGNVQLTETSAQRLHSEILAGAAKIYGTPLPQEVRDRLAHEFKVIVSKGFEDYFLVVADMLNWARSQGILVGPGRGSAAGSLIAYCLDIVKIDPLKYGLLFERFLNPDRSEMPDIDSDFEHTRRGEVIQYLVERWGEDKVSHIGGFSILRTKQAIKDAARALGFNEIGALLVKYVAIGAGGQPEPLSRMVDEAFAPGEEFRKIIQEHKEAQPVIDLALKLENSIRANSVHPCGILVSTQTITDLVPTRITKNAKKEKVRVTEWDHHNIADLGLLKLDALGLKTLGVASYTLKLLRETKGIDLTLDALPDTDDLSRPDVVKAWELIGSGNTGGIFQLESPGMQRLCVGVQPRQLSELGAVIALYRPGPMGMQLHDVYAERRNAGNGADYTQFTSNPAEIEVIDRVLGSTIGIPIYQEQLMALAGVVSGFSPSSRERVRKAVSKKIASEMDEVGRKFLEGAVSDVTEDGDPKLIFSKGTAVKLWDAIKSAGAYAFNASHAIGYAKLAWAMAYLRANWPQEMAAGMISVASDESREKLVSAVRAVNRAGIKVLPPDINVSGEQPTVDDKSVRLGLGQIKGLLSLHVNRILAARDEGGPFVSMADLSMRISLPFGVIVTLAEAGALDLFGPRLGLVMSAHAMRLMTDDEPLDIEWSAQELAWREIKRLGVLLSIDLLDEYKALFNRKAPDRYKGKVKNADIVASIGDAELGRPIAIGGVVSEFNIMTKGARRANIEITGSHKTVQGVIWGGTLDDLFGTIAEDPIHVGDVVIAIGRPSVYRQKRMVRVGIDETEGDEDEPSDVEETIAIPQIIIQDIIRVAADEPPYLDATA